MLKDTDVEALNREYRVKSLHNWFGGIKRSALKDIGRGTHFCPQCNLAMVEKGAKLVCDTCGYIAPCCQP